MLEVGGALTLKTQTLACLYCTIHARRGLTQEEPRKPEWSVGGKEHLVEPKPSVGDQPDEAGPC